MKDIGVLISAAVGLIVLYLYTQFRQKSALQGGAINPNTSTATGLTSAPTVAQIQARGPAMYSADSKQQNSAGGNAPILVWNPTSSKPATVIGTPGGTQGGSSGTTLPGLDTTPAAPVDLSPTFWAADAVPSAAESLDASDSLD